MTRIQIAIAALVVIAAFGLLIVGSNVLEPPEPAEALEYQVACDDVPRRPPNQRYAALFDGTKSVGEELRESWASESVLFSTMASCSRGHLFADVFESHSLTLPWRVEARFTAPLDVDNARIEDRFLSRRGAEEGLKIRSYLEGEGEGPSRILDALEGLAAVHPDLALLATDGILTDPRKGLDIRKGLSRMEFDALVKTYSSRLTSLGGTEVWVIGIGQETEIPESVVRQSTALIKAVLVTAGAEVRFSPTIDALVP